MDSPFASTKTLQELHSGGDLENGPVERNQRVGSGVPRFYPFSRRVARTLEGEGGGRKRAAFIAVESLNDRVKAALKLFVFRNILIHSSLHGGKHTRYDIYTRV